MQAVWENLCDAKGEQMERERLLHIYLGDHLAAITGERELAKRCMSSNKATALGDHLEHRLIPALQEDRATLLSAMTASGAPKAGWKQGAVWVAVRAGRLKLNGQMTGYSPLSRLLELEGLCLGAEGRMCLWATLTRVSDSRPLLGDFDFAAQHMRAQDQRGELETHRLEAARRALSA
jgi:hypothetical protein